MANKDEKIEALTQLLMQFKKKLAHNMNDKLTGGVTMAQLVLLKHIDLGFKTVSDLSAKLTISPPAASKLVDQLHSIELVSRIRSKDDRRIVNIELTDAGQMALKENERIRTEIFKEIVSTLDEDELDALIHILTKMKMEL